MYFITVMERIGKTDLGWLDIGSQRCWGYFKDKEAAINTVVNNVTDLNETKYDCAVIEKIGEGISAVAEFEQWFKYNAKTNKYEEIEKPETVKSYCNFAIG